MSDQNKPEAASDASAMAFRCIALATATCFMREQKPLPGLPSTHGYVRHVRIGR